MITLAKLLPHDSHNEPMTLLEVMLADINGQIRGKLLKLDFEEDLSNKQILLPKSIFACDFCGNNIEETGLVWQTGDPDYPCRFVWETLKPTPWQSGMAQVMLDMRSPEGQPIAYDPRAILQKIIARLAQKGLSATAAMELEFTLHPINDSNVMPVMRFSGEVDDRAGLYDVQKLIDHQVLFDDIIRAAKIQGLPADTIIAEAGPGQYEINLFHVNDPLLAAEQTLLLKRLIKSVARTHGHVASFMAKPFTGQPGNGLHVHVSVLDQAGNNIFMPHDDQNYSPLLPRAIAGLQQTMPDCMLMLMPNANSFKRIAKHSYAPNTSHWGLNNRNVCLRIPEGPPIAKRIEHRLAGTDANPYLIMASILAGIDYGLEHTLSPTPRTDGEPDLNPDCDIPTSPSEATMAFQNSAFVRDYFGEEFHHIYSICHQAELNRYESMIMPIEYDWFLTSA